MAGVVALVAAIVYLIGVWPDVSVQLTAAGPPLLALVGAWYAVTLVVRGFRWQVLLAPLVQVRVGTAISALALGGLASLVGQAHVGTLVRGFHLSRAGHAPLGGSLVSAAADRLFDLAGWFVLLPVLLLLHPGSIAPLLELVARLELDGRSSLLLAAGAVAVAAALAGAVAVARRRWGRRWQALLRDGRVLLRRGSAIRAAALTVLLIGVDLVVLVLAARILGLDLAASVATPLWVVVAISRAGSILGRIVPWGILGLSLQHGFFFALLVALGAFAEQAGIYVLALYAALTLSTMVGGVVVALRLTGGSVRTS